MWRWDPRARLMGSTIAGCCGTLELFAAAARDHEDVVVLKQQFAGPLCVPYRHSVTGALRLAWERLVGGLAVAGDVANLIMFSPNAFKVWGGLLCIYATTGLMAACRAIASPAAVNCE
jgi:hypothetical protein